MSVARLHPSFFTGEMQEKLANFRKKRKQGSAPSSEERRSSLSSEALSTGTLSVSKMDASINAFQGGTSYQPRRQPTLLTPMGFI